MIPRGEIAFVALVAAALTLLLAPGPALAQETTDDILIRVNGAASLAAGASVDSLVAINSPAQVAGTVRDTLVIVNQTATVSGEGDKQWVETDGIQDNDWSWQLISSCDLTPGTTSEGELTDDAGNYVYRFNGADVTTYPLNTKCANGNQADFVLVVSNMPTAQDPSDLMTLDASYDYTVNIVPRGR